MAQQKNSNNNEQALIPADAEWEAMGKNIVGTRVGNLLYLRIDMSVEVGLSTNGKSMLIASSSGFQSIPGTMASEKSWFSGNFGRKP